MQKITLLITTFFILTAQQALGDVTITNKGPRAINVHWSGEWMYTFYPNRTDGQYFVVDKWANNIQPGESRVLTGGVHPSERFPTHIVVQDPTTNAILTQQPLQINLPEIKRRPHAVTWQAVRWNGSYLKIVY